jgi:hypothetical protein
MDSRLEDRSPQEPSVEKTPEEQERWGGLLQKVAAEELSDEPWYVRLGVTLAWSAGIAVAAGIVATLVWALRALISANVSFGLASLSDHCFWAAALLMLAGMFSPSVSDLERMRERGKRERTRPKTAEERRAQSMERRLRRIYDPWRWRIWGGAGLTFGLAVLFGVFS